MRIDTNHDSSTRTPGAPSGAPAAPTAGPVSAPDRVAGWAADEWPTLAGAAHGLASVPGVVSRAWNDAAAVNTKLAAGIAASVDGWERTPPAARQPAIDALARAAANVSTAAGSVAGELAQANAVAAPTLPADVATRAAGAVHDLTAAAAAQSEKASGLIPGLSRALGASAAEVHAGLSGIEPTASALSRIPPLREMPVVGIALTAVGIDHDTRAGVDGVTASIANVGGTLLGSAAGAAAAEGLSSLIGAGAIADTTGCALGAAVAAGPAGWAVAAGVVVAAGVGYGVYRAVESETGQRIVGAVAHAFEQPAGLGAGALTSPPAAL